MAKRIFKIALVFILLILIGTFVYHQLEGWRYLDSVYFTVITMTTIGYGDFSPQTDAGKIFTIFFALSGIAVAFYVISILMKYIYVIERRGKLQQRAGIIKLRR